MAAQHLTPPGAIALDANATAVIDTYLADLASRLPAHAPMASDVVAEIRGDLIESTEALVPGSPSMLAAARTATTEFGNAETIAAALRPELAARQARRIGIALLISGPLVGVCWLASLFLAGPTGATAWRWLVLIVAPALLVGAPATAITVVTTGRLTRWLHLPATLASATAAVAGVAAGVGDVMLLAGSGALLLMPVPAPSPLVAIAATASLARLGFVALSAARALGWRRPVRRSSAVACSCVHG